jgi:epithelial splicing regulatory protein 1/2
MCTSDEEAARALLKHRDLMGPRYIELFRSTSAEVQQVLKRSQDPKYLPQSGVGGASKEQMFMMSKFNNNPNSNIDTAQLITPLALLPPEMLSGRNRKDCVRLRNLPIDCAVEQILEFLGIHSQHIIQHGVHMILNNQRQPSGEAFIQFDSEQAAYNVHVHKNAKSMHFNSKKIPIEVIQCSGEEMNLVLMGILPSNLINSPQGAKSKIPRLKIHFIFFNIHKKRFH